MGTLSAQPASMFPVCNLDQSELKTNGNQSASLRPRHVGDEKVCFEASNVSETRSATGGVAQVVELSVYSSLFIESVKELIDKLSSAYAIHRHLYDGILCLATFWEVTRNHFPVETD